MVPIEESLLSSSGICGEVNAGTQERRDANKRERSGTLERNILKRSAKHFKKWCLNAARFTEVQGRGICGGDFLGAREVFVISERMQFVAEEACITAHRETQTFFASVIFAPVAQVFA